MGTNVPPTHELVTLTRRKLRPVRRSPLGWINAPYANVSQHAAQSNAMLISVSPREFRYRRSRTLRTLPGTPPGTER